MPMFVDDLWMLCCSLSPQVHASLRPDGVSTLRRTFGAGFPTGGRSAENWEMRWMMWMEEVLRQLVDGLSFVIRCNPIIYSVS